MIMLTKLEAVTDIAYHSFNDYLDALKNRMIFLHQWVVLFPIMDWNRSMQKIIPMQR